MATFNTALPLATQVLIPSVARSINAVAVNPAGGGAGAVPTVGQIWPRPT